MAVGPRASGVWGGSLGPALEQLGDEAAPTLTTPADHISFLALEGGAEHLAPTCYICASITALSAIARLNSWLLPL